MANFKLNSDNNRQPGSANADLIDGRDDNDTLTGLPQLSIKGMTLTEGHGGASLATFTLRLSKPASQIVTVNYATRDGTATAGPDYMAASNLISFIPGQTTASIRIPILGDTVDEPDERVTVQLSNPVNAQLTGKGTASVIITDDDQPDLALIDSLSVTEGDSGSGTARLEVTLSAPSWQPVSVRYTTLDDTARAGLDYTAMSGTLTFQPGETRLNLDIPILADTTVERDEVFQVQLEGVRNARLLNAKARITLRNDDMPSLSIGGLTLAEGDSGETRIQLPVNLSTVVSRTVTVNYETTDDTARAGSDYTASRGSLTFAPGETLKTVVIPVQGDTEAEPDERFTVNLTDARNALIHNLTNSATVLITNDDLPVIRMAALSQPEGSDPFRYISLAINLSAPSSQTIRVNYATVDGTAINGSDYLELDGSLSFAPGQTRQTLDIPVLGDTLAETDETFRVVLSAPVNARLDSAAGADITLTDDDRPPTFSIRDARLSEGNTGSSSVNLVVTLSRTGTEPVTVDYTTVNGTAQAGSDYTKTSGSLSFAPGEIRKTLSVPVLGDSKIETDEIFQVKLANASSNARIDTAASTATVTVTNDDLPVLAISGTSVTEGDSGSRQASLTVSLSAAYSETVTVDYATADGTAQAGSDYTATSGSLSFAPGETRKSLSVSVLGDTLFEADESFADESFQVLLRNAAHALLNPDLTAGTVQVGNDDLAKTASGQVVHPVIDLGKNYGKLIKPVQVDGGRFFYYWDISGDGTSADTKGAGYANSRDWVTHDWLDQIFQQDVNGRIEGTKGAPVVRGDGDTDNTYRFATINGVKLALPTIGNGDNFIGSGEWGYRNGTAVSGTASNPTYDDYLAIWDAYNGTGTGTDRDGTPGGWGTGYVYWSATPSASDHVSLGIGEVRDLDDTVSTYVAVEVW